MNSSTKKTFEGLKTVTIDADEVLITLCKCSVKEAIQKAAERLYGGDVKAPSVDKETFIFLATLLGTNVLRQIHDGTYKTLMV